MSRTTALTRPRGDRAPRAYTSGIMRPDRGPASPLAARSARVANASEGLVDLTAPAVPRTGRAALAVGTAVALHGCVLTPDRMMEDTYVVVDEDGVIASVSKRRPDDAKVLRTDGVILPGLIDLHGHPQFNVFAAWEPPTMFINRYQWRGSDIYQAIVREPWDALKSAGLADVAARYAEVRAVVGGTTAVQGAPQRFDDEEALVRNVDRFIFGTQPGRSMVDLPSSMNDDLREVLDGITNGDVTAFYVHVAEGRHDNQRSVDEFDRLAELHALTSSTIIIHGTAITDAQFGDVKDAGAKLVWSPQSNLRLYGETTNIKRVLDLDIPLALGADWLPSGSRSLLDEMRVARRQVHEKGARITARQLVQMVTRDAARIAGLGDRLGVLASKRVADVLVLERRNEDPWENVLEADPSWVQMVMIDGDIAYARLDLLERIVPAATIAALERVDAWGNPMVLDTSYAVKPRNPPLRLADLRAQLIAADPRLGPIFA
jgi:5-methylthioadenosine/S-adenosylhomocysteine deaminase